MRLCRCDLCGDRASQVRLRVAHDIPLAVVARTAKSDPGEGPFAFEFVDEDKVPIPGTPIVCERCFQGDCKRVLDSNRRATVGGFLDFIRRRTASWMGAAPTPRGRQTRAMIDARLMFLTERTMT
jgi:hypothetical protein